MVALTDAIVEPLANAVWYFLLDKIWASKVQKIKLNNPHKLSFLTQPLNLSDFILHQLFLHFFTLHNLPFFKITNGFEYIVGLEILISYHLIVIAAFFLIIEKYESIQYYFHDLLFF